MNPYDELLTDEVKEQLAKDGYERLYSEARDRKAHERGPLTEIQDFLKTSYDKFINQYNSLQNKIDKHLEDSIDKMAERFNDDLSRLKEGLRKGEYEGREEEIQKKIDDLEDVNTREEIYNLIKGMLDTKLEDMSFLEYILHQLV